MKKVIKNNKNIKPGVLIYQAKNGAIELRGDLEHDNVWATQLQIANIFGVNVRTISEHLLNIFKNRELNKNSVIRNFRITALDGKSYDTNFYSLDAIISGGLFFWRQLWQKLLHPSTYNFLQLLKYSNSA